MHIRIPLATALCVLLISPVMGAQTRTANAHGHPRRTPEWARNVADRFAFGGTDVIAAAITGKFNSPDLLAETLDLRSVVGNNGSKPVRLRDILHSIDLNGNGSVAAWKVVGPKPIVEHYVEELQTGFRTKKLFYDFGVELSSATICCPD